MKPKTYRCETCGMSFQSAAPLPVVRWCQACRAQRKREATSRWYRNYYARKRAEKVTELSRLGLMVFARRLAARKENA